ncbi:methyltransferase domain-containing protein [Apodospora peruviana]|uniref:Methyltransferase domain-containing protein n=1 Tax=Apodospora peruviana TaxID=516989 RepID=A0AAE0ITH5_9PEZI|nr:methyltransferase domain-containing protein [Apodospora peruviana]
MLPTPDTSHVPYQRVYEPAEDSFLLLDTLSSATETAYLARRFGSSIVAPLILEVGPGSGVVIAFLTANARTIFGTSDILTLGVDVNGFACAATEKTVSRAVVTENNSSSTKRQDEERETGTFLAAVQGDLTSPLRPGTIDMLVFNPPYVPTAELPAAAFAPSSSSTQTTTFRQDSHLLELSYAGGKDGMETTDRLIAALPIILSKRGCAYILLCAQNRPEEVKERVRRWSGGGVGEVWKAETVGTSGKQAGWEKLQIIRIWRETNV